MTDNLPTAISELDALMQSVEAGIYANFDKMGTVEAAETRAIKAREAFRALATLLARYRELEYEYGRLYAFVEDVRNSKKRATTDEEHIMAFVRLGNAAENLLAKLAANDESKEQTT